MHVNDTRSDENPLLISLRERIRREGPLRLDRYMQACLADPEHGYWSRPQSIGSAGDFVTAPEISQIFGELIGLWCAVAWQQVGSPRPLRLIELGPGRGTLMRDALRAARRVPAFIEAAKVHLVEVSAALRETQRRTLTPHLGSDALLAGDVDIAVEWHDALTKVPDGPAIVIANEFLDALPIRQLVFADGAWRERVVVVDATGALAFATGAIVDVGAETTDAEPGTTLELRGAEERLMAELAARGASTLALFIDYGPATASTGDTLQAVRRHAYIDPLSAPGTADITAHVQFARLARKARAAGLNAGDPITQAEFLGRLGIAERAARLMAANPDLAAGIGAGVQRLMSPTGMGQLFKVLTISSPDLPLVVPFG